MCVYVCARCVRVHVCEAETHMQIFNSEGERVCVVCRVWGDMAIKEMRGECQRFLRVPLSQKQLLVFNVLNLCRKLRKAHADGFKLLQF